MNAPAAALPRSHVSVREVIAAMPDDRPFTIDEMVALTGASKPTVCRAFRCVREAGLIEAAGTRPNARPKPGGRLVTAWRVVPV